VRAVDARCKLPLHPASTALFSLHQIKLCDIEMPLPVMVIDIDIRECKEFDPTGISKSPGVPKNFPQRSSQAIDPAILKPTLYGLPKRLGFGRRRVLSERDLTSNVIARCYAPLKLCSFKPPRLAVVMPCSTRGSWCSYHCRSGSR
jgi:hypothetical protein